MTRKSLPFRGAESVLDPLTLESEMRIAALAAPHARPPQPTESWDPVADMLALYTDPPRPRSPLSAITVGSFVASIRQAAQQLRRIPDVAAQARAADTLPALISPAEARLLQSLGGSGRVDRHGIRHFDNPALTSDPAAPASAAAPTPDVNVLDFSGQSALPGPAPVSTDCGWLGQFDPVAGAFMPPDASNVDYPQGDLSRPFDRGGADAPSPPPSFSAAGDGYHKRPPLPTESTLTPNALGALMALPVADAAQDRPGRFHDQIRDELAAYLRARGAIAQTEVGVVGLAPDPLTRLPAPTAVDILAQVPPRMPQAVEVKTGNNPRYTRNQQVTYPQLIVGHAQSFDPKIQTFGFSIGQVLPPTPLIQYYQPYNLKIKPDVRVLGPDDVTGE